MKDSLTTSIIIILEDGSYIVTKEEVLEQTIEFLNKQKLNIINKIKVSAETTLYIEGYE